MNVGIIGLPQCGKKTLFGLLVGADALASHNDPRKLLRGVADVQDSRFDRLVQMYQPKSEVRARLEFVLLPKIEEKAVSEGDLFRDMGDIDAFVHVVRAFEDDSVYHMWGGVDPMREIEFVSGELVLHDLLFVEKRLERLTKELMKVKNDRGEKEKALLEKFQAQLEEEKPLRLLELDDNERALISSYPFLSLRQLIFAINVGDDQLGDDSLVNDVRAKYGDQGVRVIKLAALAESDIAQLDPDERGAFMEELGISEPALPMLTRECIDSLGLCSFFTVGKDEVRQWFVRIGSLAPRAAGAIHSDLERGFIRAEVIKYDDLLAAGSEEGVKNAGKHYVKGKDYVVEDGDILTIRFNV